MEASDFSKLTAIQRRRAMMWVRGMTPQQIAVMEHVTPRAVWFSLCSAMKQLRGLRAMAYEMGKVRKTS